MPMEESGGKVKSLAKALSLLECFTVAEPVLGITELAQKLGITKSNAHNIVATFQEKGYLKQLPDSRYTLDLKMLEYTFVINQHLGYPAAVYDVLMEEKEKTGRVIYFGLPYGDYVLYLYVAHPVQLLPSLPYREMTGEKAFLYRSGIGKAILSAMPDEEVLMHLPQVLEQKTPYTITNKDDLLKNLQAIRERGYSIDNQENEPGIRCVGVPVRDLTGKLVGAISASGPASDMSDEYLMECSKNLIMAANKMKERIYQS